MAREINLKDAINAVSDVVQNRPRPLREFDQIYMKTGDMVMQSELVARWAKDKRVAFIGDGDAISVCVALLKSQGIFDEGPSHITVFDFDERICGAITRIADHECMTNLESRLYNATLPNFAAAAGYLPSLPLRSLNRSVIVRTAGIARRKNTAQLPLTQETRGESSPLLQSMNNVG